MEESVFEDLLNMFLNSPATKSMLGEVDGVEVISSIKAIVPQGNFAYKSLYITITTNIPEWIESSEILLSWNMDPRYWEDSIIPDILDKYFYPERDRIAFVKVISKQNVILFPETWGPESQYNNF